MYKIILMMSKEVLTMLYSQNLQQVKMTTQEWNIAVNNINNMNRAEASLIKNMYDNQQKRTDLISENNHKLYTQLWNLGLTVETVENLVAAYNGKRTTHYCTSVQNTCPSGFCSSCVSCQGCNTCNTCNGNYTCGSSFCSSGYTFSTSSTRASVGSCPEYFTCYGGWISTGCSFSCAENYA